MHHLRDILDRCHEFSTQYHLDDTRLSAEYSLRHWQAGRLQASYQDLANDPKYVDATHYFLAELYAADKELSHDLHVEKMYPLLIRILPSSLIGTLTKALRLQLLSAKLDRLLTEKLLQMGWSSDNELVQSDYALAYRHCDNYEERCTQINLISEVGRDIDYCVTKPLIYRLLKLSRGPAVLAGLSDFQRFLEVGFSAFAKIGGASEFLQIVTNREHDYLDLIYAGDSKPFKNM